MNPRMPPWLAVACERFPESNPQAVAAGARPGVCGPVAFAFATYLRRHGHQAGLLHVFGEPATATSGLVGHYLTTAEDWVVDWAYRSLDGAAPAPVVYPREELRDPVPFRGWTLLSAELPPDGPLRPSFVRFGAPARLFLTPGRAA